MMAPPGLSSGWRVRIRGRALMALFGLACLAGCVVATPSFAQLLAFPPREKPIPRTAPSAGQEQMLVRAQEINYDYSNERVSAVGNVQLYYGASTLEADRVIYDQKTKRLHAEGNVRLTQPDGERYQCTVWIVRGEGAVVVRREGDGVRRASPCRRQGRIGFRVADPERL